MDPGCTRIRLFIPGDITSNARFVSENGIATEHKSLNAIYNSIIVCEGCNGVV